jgi:nitrous oxide reductase accessory protein NosL
MRIGMHGGPNGQIFYAEQDPEPMGDGGTAADGPDGVAWFHTLVRGLFPYHFRRVDRGWTADVIYITDYSAVDWELFEREGDRYMPSPTDPETFGDATELTYVAESSVLGGMGPDLIPFSADRDADAFIDDHGGRTVAFGDIDRALIRGIRRSGDR